MSNKSALEIKYQKIVQALGDLSSFYMDEVQKIFPEMKKSSLYWNMSKLVEEGYLKRVRNGVYAVNEWKGKRTVSIAGAAERLKDVLDETGFEFYISGLDILQRYMQHVPEKYPIIVFVEKRAKEEVEDVLRTNFFEVCEPAQITEMKEKYALTNQATDLVVLYQTEAFAYSENGLATIEKAFVDLYYAVTRNEYPVALQELVRMYENLIRLGNIDKKKLITVATKRSLQHDIRFIAESKFITDQAIKFVEILRKEE